jgi:AbrB family looped-hinge helix DNA binding protein
MPEFKTRLTAKGQVTIPQEIRRLIGLQPHDIVRFEVVGEEIRIRRVASKLLAGFGAVTSQHQPENFRSTCEEFEKAVAEEVVSEA